MVTYLLKKSYQLKTNQEIKFNDLWGDKGVFTTMWIFGKPAKILFFKKHIKNLIKSEQTSESFFIYDNYNGQKDKYLDKLFQKSYSLRIFDMQYIARHSNSHTPTKLINNVEYLIILQEDLQINRMKIYEEFKDNLKIEFTLFCKFLDEYTDNNHALIIHLKSQSDILQDKLFWYNISDNNNSFKMCSEEAWNYNNEHLIKENNNIMYQNKILFDRNFLF